MRKLASLLLFLAVAASAQTHQEQLTVQVIEVPVYVERNGNSVPGLSKENFELFVNGAKQPIDYFDVLDDVATDEEVPLQRRRLFMLLFDLANSHPFAIQAAKTATSQFVVESAPGDTFAVATIGHSGIRFVIPFTTDRVALQRAIATLAPTRAGDPFNLATLDTERKEWAKAAPMGDGAIGTPTDVFGANPVIGSVVQGSSSGNSVAKDGSNAGEVHTAQMSVEYGKKNDDSVKEQDERALIGTLGALADRMASLSGVKHVLLLSGGTERGDRSDIYDAANEMHARFRAAGVILSGIDFTTDKGIPSPRGRTEIGPNPLLRILATDTGGAVSTSLRSIRDMHRITYVLGFKPQEKQKKQNDIKVKLKDVPWGTMVRHRNGYSTETPSKRSDDLLLADVLLNDIPQNGITVDVAVVVGPKTTNVESVLPGRELLAYASGKPLVLDVFVYVFNEKNLPVDWTYSRLTLDLEKGREFLTSNPYKLNKEFKLSAGNYSAKTVVRVTGTAVTGFKRTDFQVP